MPFGPSILWPENAAKSTPSAPKSTGMCGTDWQASSTVIAPTAEASSTSSATGATKPVTFETCENAKMRVRAVMAARASSSDQVPCSSTGMYRNVAPVFFASRCHGIRFAWCSASVTRISSPAPSS